MGATLLKTMHVTVLVWLAIAFCVESVPSRGWCAAAAQGGSRLTEEKGAAESVAPQTRDSPEAPLPGQAENHGGDKTAVPAGTQQPQAQQPKVVQPAVREPKVQQPKVVHFAEPQPKQPDEPQPKQPDESTEPLQQARDEKARENLRRAIDVSFVETPLDEALQVLAEATHGQVFLDRRGLVEAGIKADAPVDLTLHDVPAEMILGLMLDQLGLDYYIKHGVIVVTTAEKAVAELQARVYPVQDLIEPVGVTRRSPDTEASRLTDVIQSSVEPDSWQDNGGRGTIRYYRGTLVVLQTAKVHQAVARLLEELRQATHQREKEEPAHPPAEPHKPPVVPLPSEP